MSVTAAELTHRPEYAELSRQLRLSAYVAWSAQGDQILQAVGGQVVATEEPSRLDVVNVERGALAAQAAILARMAVALPGEAALSVPVRPVRLSVAISVVPMLFGVLVNVVVPAGSRAEAGLVDDGAATTGQLERALTLKADHRNGRLATLQVRNARLGGRQFGAVFGALGVSAQHIATSGLVARRRAEARGHAWRPIEDLAARLTGQGCAGPGAVVGIRLAGAVRTEPCILARAVAEDPLCAADLPRCSLNRSTAVRALDNESVSSRHPEIIPDSKQRSMQI